MGYRHTEDEIVAAAAAVVVEHGLGGLTYRKVADRLGISDRMVVYYLPTKTALVEAAVVSLSVSLQGLLADAFGDDRRDADELVRSAWPVLASPDADRVFAVFFELVGLASAQTAPYDALADALLSGWVEWLTERTTGRTAVLRRRAALGAIARLDGLLLLRRTLGPAMADEAATALGLHRPAAGSGQAPKRRRAASDT